MSTKKIKNCFLILIILIIGTYCSHESPEKKYRNPENEPIFPPDYDKNPEGHQRDPKDTSKESEEEKLKKQVEEKMEENLKLKKEIENKLKYIIILLVTGVIMLAIIIAILIKVCFCKNKKKIKVNNSSTVELRNKEKNKINSNNEIEDSSYNILNSSLKNSTNISSNEISIQNNSSSDNNISVEVYHFLYMVGIVFLFRRENKFYISMTDDVYNVIKKMDLNGVQKIVDENTKVYNLVRSMVELYGVFSYSYLDYYYSLYYGNGEELDAPNNALLFCQRADNIDIIHTEHNMYFVHNVLQHRDLEPLLDDIISRQSSIKRKPIKLEELLIYCDYDYYEETESKNKFKKYLKDKNVTSDIIETVIKIISDMYRLGNNFISASIKMLQDYGIEVTNNNMQEIY